MAADFLTARTLDDLMRLVIDAIRTHGTDVTSTKGPHRELSGVLLELVNPRARLSRTETRGKPFSSLGELCWYLAGSDDCAFISYYLPQYKKLSEWGRVHGAYGPRLLGWKGCDQLQHIIRRLREHPTSRKAVIQLFDAVDLQSSHKDVPCTCTLQYMVRGDKLHALTTMRSNDVYWGLAHDVFSFTMLQELIARSLSLEVGGYKHFAGSLHIYAEHQDSMTSFLDEGWQPTNEPMPAMPFSDPWPSIAALLRAEEAIRRGSEPSSVDFVSLNPYWQDLVRLLRIFTLSKRNRKSEIQALRKGMAAAIYDPFIESRLA